jgi:hypothetical protein
MPQSTHPHAHVHTAVRLGEAPHTGRTVLIPVHKVLLAVLPHDRYLGQHADATPTQAVREVTLISAQPSYTPDAALLSVTAYQSGASRAPPPPTTNNKHTHVYTTIIVLSKSQCSTHSTGPTPDPTKPPLAAATHLSPLP